MGSVQGYRIWSGSLDLGLVLADSHDRIRNWAVNTGELWLPEYGISARRREKNPYAIALLLLQAAFRFRWFGWQAVAPAKAGVQKRR